MRSLNRFQIMSEEEAVAMILEYQKTHSDDLQAKLLRNYTRLVALFANRHAGFLKYSDDKQDLMQIGLISVLEKLKQFDPSHQVKASSFLGNCAEYEIISFLQSSHAIKLNHRVIKRIKNVQKYIEKFKDKFGYEPDHEDLVIHSKGEITNQDLMLFDDYQNGKFNVVSYDDFTSNETPLSEFIPATPNRDMTGLINLIADILPCLKEKEKTVIQLVFGLEPFTRPHTLTEIGTMFNVSRERIRQIKNKALIKLERKLKFQFEINMPYQAL